MAVLGEPGWSHIRVLGDCLYLPEHRLLHRVVPRLHRAHFWSVCSVNAFTFTLQSTPCIAIAIAIVIAAIASYYSAKNYFIMVPPEGSIFGNFLKVSCIWLTTAPRSVHRLTNLDSSNLFEIITDFENLKLLFLNLGSKSK